MFVFELVVVTDTVSEKCNEEEATTVPDPTFERDDVAINVAIDVDEAVLVAV